MGRLGLQVAAGEIGGSGGNDSSAIGPVAARAALIEQAGAVLNGWLRARACRTNGRCCNVHQILSSAQFQAQCGMGCIDVGNLRRGLGLRVLGHGLESGSQKEGQEEQMGNVPSRATMPELLRDCRVVRIALISVAIAAAVTRAIALLAE